MAETASALTITIENKIQIIRFNNPKRKNAIKRVAYVLIKEALDKSASNPDVLFTVFTGTGEYYSSGFDIIDSSNDTSEEDATVKLSAMINSFIDYPKLLVAVVNGPAIGLAVTTLGLCDIVYCSDKATFTTPFSKLGLCAEGCASYTFPRILGKSKANEMLLVGHKMTAEEAYQFGFVSKVFKHSEMGNIWQYIEGFKKLSPQSLKLTKEMCRRFDVEQLKQANEAEMKGLRECVQSEDFMQAIMNFMSQKSKL